MDRECQHVGLKIQREMCFLSQSLPGFFYFAGKSLAHSIKVENMNKRVGEWVCWYTGPELECKL